jgi:hypothetical protein
MIRASPTKRLNIEGEEMTICFHVDDCKLSHRKIKVMDSMIEYLRKGYENIFEDGSGTKAVIRGNMHKYIDMNVDYTVLGQVKITMLDYVNEIIDAFDKAEPKGGGTKSTVAPESLFKVDESCEKIKQDKSVEFHNLVAKTSYADELCFVVLSCVFCNICPSRLSYLQGDVLLCCPNTSLRVAGRATSSC